MNSFEQMVRGAMAKYRCNRAVAEWRVRQAMQNIQQQEHISLVCRKFSKAKKCSMAHARNVYRLLHG